MSRACELNSHPGDGDWGCVIVGSYGYYVLLAGGLATVVATWLLLLGMRSWGARAAVGAALAAIGALAVWLGPTPLCKGGLACAIPGAIAPGFLFAGAALLVLGAVGFASRRVRA
jgi:hypothetical protein